MPAVVDASKRDGATTGIEPRAGCDHLWCASSYQRGVAIGFIEEPEWRSGVDPVLRVATDPEIVRSGGGLRLLPRPQRPLRRAARQHLAAEGELLVHPVGPSARGPGWAGAGARGPGWAGVAHGAGAVSIGEHALARDDNRPRPPLSRARLRPLPLYSLRTAQALGVEPGPLRPFQLIGRQRAQSLRDLFGPDRFAARPTPHTRATHLARRPPSRITRRPPSPSRIAHRRPRARESPAVALAPAAHPPSPDQRRRMRPVSSTTTR